MNLTTIEAGSGEISVSIPAEWVRRAFLEGGEKLCALVEAIKEMERFDFKYIVYPKLLKERQERVDRVQVSQEKPKHKPYHRHAFATIKKKLLARGFIPYCLICGEPNP